jgi:hypothetical protein
MKTSTTIFFRAIGVYLLLTLPALLEPIFYIYSALFMLMYCWFAGIIFCVVFYILQATQVKYNIANIVLIITIPISVAIALQLMEVFGTWDNVWQAGTLLLFPFAAAVAGWISKYQSRQDIKVIFSSPTIETIPITEE